MYNGQVINVLLKERGLRAKDLLEHLQLQSNGSITSLVKGNPTAERLEKIADFFDVPIDTLFQRAKSYGYNVIGNSNNVASIVMDNEKAVIVASQRSNVMSALDNQAATVKAAFQLAGAEVVQGDGYPAWKMRADSKLTAVTVETYKELFGKAPKVLGIHAGLECGLFSEKYPNLDMVSFGPTLRGVHSPDERLLIPTVQMVWDHLLAILKKV